MNSQSAKVTLELMKHVERAVRPVYGTWKQKMQMRAELLTRLIALYDEEFARLGDARDAVLRAAERAGSPAELSAQLQRSLPRRTYWKCRIAETCFGRPEETAFRRAARVAATVVLILVLGLALRPLCVLVGLIPQEFPFSWSGYWQEMLVKPAGAFFVVLFLHLVKRLIRTRRRSLALVLVAVTGLLVFSASLVTFGPAQVFSMSALTGQAIIAWLGLILVPAALFGVILQLEPAWIQAGEWSDLSID